MGWCLTWYAVKGKTPELVPAELGLKRTGESVPATGQRPPIFGAVLPSGWYLVQRTRYESNDENVLVRLSTGCEVISLFVEEHVMVSRASRWENGKRMWEVDYEEERRDWIEVFGELPPEYVVIRQEVKSNPDAGVGDFFDIPCRLAEALTGYRYDAPWKERVVTSFDVLARPPLWKKLFG